MTHISLDDISWLPQMEQGPIFQHINPPAFYTGEFVVTGGVPLDTYINLSGWGKVNIRTFLIIKPCDIHQFRSLLGSGIH